MLAKQHWSFRVYDMFDFQGLDQTFALDKIPPTLKNQNKKKIGFLEL